MARHSAPVVLDANVLYNPGLRDFLLNMGAKGLFFPVWTETILQELERSIVRKRPELSTRVRRTMQAMDDFFWNSKVLLKHEDLKDLTLPDRNDVHVLAAAIKSRALTIVTFNLRDFPVRILRGYGVQAMHPDVFCESMIIRNPEIVKQLFATQVVELRKPALSESQVLGELEKIGMRRTVKLLG